MWALVDPSDPNLIWSTSTNSDTGQVYLWSRRTQQADEVSPYARYNVKRPSVLPYRFNWETPIAFTTSASRACSSAETSLFESADRGRTGTILSPDLTRNEQSHQTASGGPIDPRHLRRGNVGHDSRRRDDDAG